MLIFSEEEGKKIEHFAECLDKLELLMTGESRSAKMYDPMTCEYETQVLHSYTFDLRDGGRHHKASDYNDLDDLFSVMLNETAQRITRYTIYV